MVWKPWVEHHSEPTCPIHLCHGGMLSLILLDSNIDRDEYISASVLMMVNLVLPFMRWCFMEIGWDWMYNCGEIPFFCPGGHHGAFKTDLGNLCLIYCPLTETSDQHFVY